jgi:RNA polymerase sigma factor (sigma-70 family)
MRARHTSRPPRDPARISGMHQADDGSFTPPDAEACPDTPDEGRARAGAVSDLFRQHNQTLIRFLAARLHNEQEAREVAQEAYVRLLELGRTGAVSFLRAYLFRIAANLAIDRIRARNIRDRIEAAKAEPPADLIDQALVEKHVFAADDMKVFWASLEELPSLMRQAFVLSRVEGLSTPEIAKQLDKSERMIRRYIVHALLYCRHRINGMTAAQAKERTGNE